MVSKLEKGQIIVMEGVDGSGKTTQNMVLYDRLKEIFRDQCMEYKFPSYGKPQAALAEMYLWGKFGVYSDLNMYQAVSFYAVDRLATYLLSLRSFYEKKGVILLDRYTTSNILHHSCRATSKEQVIEAIKWIEDFEYDKLQLPRPDMVFYLYLSDLVAEKVLLARTDNTGIKNDIHESDLEYLRKVRKNSIICAEYLNWNIVDCTNYNEGVPRPKEDIHQEIYQEVQKRLKLK